MSVRTMRVLVRGLIGVLAIGSLACGSTFVGRVSPLDAETLGADPPLRVEVVAEVSAGRSLRTAKPTRATVHLCGVGDPFELDTNVPNFDAEEPYASRYLELAPESAARFDANHSRCIVLALGPSLARRRDSDRGGERSQPNPFRWRASERGLRFVQTLPFMVAISCPLGKELSEQHFAVYVGNLDRVDKPSATCQGARPTSGADK